MNLLKDAGRKSGLIWTLVLLFSAAHTCAYAKPKDPEPEKLPGVGANVDSEQVTRWNQFAQALYALHKQQIERTKDVEIKETVEQYGGLLAKDKDYRTLYHYDRASGRLLSRVQWKPTDSPRLMVIEVYQYDESGHLERDYAAAYLPVYHNAPFQTLINVHYRDKTIRSYRQFDASGLRIYEQCKGTLNGKPINLSLDDYNIPRSEYEQDQIEPRGAYWSCFGFLPDGIDSEIEALLALAPTLKGGNTRSPASSEEIERKIAELTEQIKREPNDARLLLQRGQMYNQMYQFDAAIADFDQAINLDDSMDQAYFGRGMALGRAGRVKEGIDDLSVFISRNPASSLAYTKRGVRYLWLGDDARAKRDMENAILLDSTNAEAHDDLGVILARAGEYEKAEQHFKATIKHDPSYQKAYHNLALVYYLTKRFELGLKVIDDALRLQQNSRESLLLKSEILDQLGQHKQARALREEAEFLPQINWTEQLSVQ